MTSPVESIPIDAARDVFEVNFWGFIKTTQKFLPLIRKHTGRVITVSSIHGVISTQGSSIYSATKRAMEGAVDSLRQEMSEFGVSVSSVLPGYIKTAIAEKGTDWINKVSEDQRELYSSFWQRIVAGRKKSHDNASGPEVTSAAIIHALTDPHPYTRYAAGDAHGIPGSIILSFVTMLPDRLLDWLTAAVRKH